jgi:predicted permease
MHIIDTLAPVFLIIILGAVLKRTAFLTDSLLSGLNRLVYWVGLPALLFYEVAIASYDIQAVGKTFVVVFTGMLGSIIVGYIVAFILKLPVASIGTFVQGAFRGNLMYIGLPIIIYSFAGNHSAGQMSNISALVLGFIVPFYNIAAVVILLASQHKIDKHIIGKVFYPLITNPLLIACVLGLVYSAARFPMPLSLARSFDAISKMALPLALIAIGGTLAESKAVIASLSAFVCSLIKIAITPLIGFAVAYLLHLGSDETRVALIYLACPTAVVSYVFAEQLKGDAKMAAAIVFVSTVLSIVPLGVIVALF